MNTLVILYANPRGGEETWASMYKHLLAPFSADLALCFGASQKKTASLYSKATFLWEIPEYSDWADYYKEHCKNGEGYWQKSFAIGEDKGLSGMGKTRGSGCIIFAIRHYLKNYCMDTLLQYDRIILSRSDHYYLFDHPILDNDFFWIVEGEDYYGVCDRHWIFPSKLAAKVLSVVEYMDSKLGYMQIRNLVIPNCESVLFAAIRHNGLLPIMKRAPRVAFAVRTNHDSTRWNDFRFPFWVNSNLSIKYPQELAKSVYNFLSTWGEKEWRANTAIINNLLIPNTNRIFTLEEDLHKNFFYKINDLPYWKKVLILLWYFVKRLPLGVYRRIHRYWIIANFAARTHKIMHPRQYNICKQLQYLENLNKSIPFSENTLTCTVCLCVYENQYGLPFVLANVLRMKTLFGRLSAIAYYDDSKDDSLRILERFATFFPLEIIHAQSPKPVHNFSDIWDKEREHPRDNYILKTKHLAAIRNTLLSAVYAKDTDDDSYFIMMDSNDYACIGDLDTKILADILCRQDWDCVSFDRAAGYYDWFALSYNPYFWSNFHYKSYWKQVENEMAKDFISRLHSLCIQEPGALMEVYSAFNGFALYRKAAFTNCHYDSEIDINLFPYPLEEMEHLVGHYFSNARDFDCEHRSFHLQAIKKNNARIRVSPQKLFARFKYPKPGAIRV